MNESSYNILMLLGVVSGWLLMLTVFGALADFVLPHCPCITRLLEKAFKMELSDDDRERRGRDMALSKNIET